MKQILTIVVGFMFCAGAYADVYTDDMARCLVSSTSSKDRTDLVRWMVVNAALHPEVESIVSVTPDVREQLNRDVASLLERLATDTCSAQAEEAFRYEGAAAFKESFSALGRVAMRELMTDKTVAEGFGAFTKYIDQSKFKRKADLD